MGAEVGLGECDREGGIGWEIEGRVSLAPVFYYGDVYWGGGACAVDFWVGHAVCRVELVEAFEHVAPCGGKLAFGLAGFDNECRSIDGCSDYYQRVMKRTWNYKMVLQFCTENS